MAIPLEVKAEAAAIQDIASRLNDIQEGLSMGVDRMRRVVDRAFGGNPAGQSGSATPRPVPSGEIGAIKDKLNDIDALMSDHGDLLNRLDKIV